MSGDYFRGKIVRSSFTCDVLHNIYCQIAYYVVSHSDRARAQGLQAGYALKSLGSHARILEACKCLETFPLVVLLSFCNHISLSKNNKKKLLLALFSTLLLVVSVVSVVVGVNSHKNYNDNNNASSSSSLPLSNLSHTIIKKACSSTFYPELCFSAISSGPGVTHKISTHKDVIELSLNITARAVENNFFTVEKLLTTKKGLMEREKTSLHDCLETIDETLDELKQSHEDLKFYPNKKTLYQHADDLKTIISSAIRNQVTCLDGFPHKDADKKVRKALEEGQVHVEHLCINALTMTIEVNQNLLFLKLVNEERE